MKNIVLSYYEQLIKEYVSIIVYDGMREICEKAVFVHICSSKKYRVGLFKNKKNTEKELSIDGIEELLSSKCKYQMLMFDCKEDKKDFYGMIGKASKKKGICSPFVEVEDYIMYFPRLRYSDVELLRYLCEQRKIEGYRLLMVSGC